MDNYMLIINETIINEGLRQFVIVWIKAHMMNNSQIQCMESKLESMAH